MSHIQHVSKRKKKSFYEIIEPWLFLVPALIVFIAFLYFPFFKTIYLSNYLTDRNGIPKVYYGLKNYEDILLGKYSKAFWNSMWVTMRFVFFVAFGSLMVGFLTSLLTAKKFPSRAFASAIYAMPIAIASAAAAMSFKMIFHPS
ncbi:MAG: sugar ABC transporter permease, partial [Bacteroidales bacterium]|nr:sugar ABC transporter permease [Bacteroidales bacterium]